MKPTKTYEGADGPVDREPRAVPAAARRVAEGRGVGPGPAAKLPAHGPYDLRHTYASLLLAPGVPMTFVSHQLEHSRPATTLRHDTLDFRRGRSAADLSGTGFWTQVSRCTLVKPMDDLGQLSTAELPSLPALEVLSDGRERPPQLLLVGSSGILAEEALDPLAAAGRRVRRCVIAFRPQGPGEPSPPRNRYCRSPSGSQVVPRLEA